MTDEMTPQKFDRMMQSDRLEGSAAIAHAIGVSEYTVRRWVRRPDIPIYKPAGRIIAFRSELENWIRCKSVKSVP